MPASPRIWVVNHYAGGPGIGTGWRHWELARRWMRLGADVHVFAASTSIGGRQDEGRSGSRLVDGVPYHFVETPSYGGNGLGRLCNMLYFNRRIGPVLRRAALGTSGPPDIIIASSPQPLAWPAVARAARTLHASFVPEIRDLWPESLQELAGLPRWHPLVTWCRRADRMAMQAADLVMSPLHGIEAAMRARGHASVPCITVPNGVTLDGAGATELPPALRDKVDAARSQSKRLLLYAGAIGIPNAMDSFVEAVTCLDQAQQRRLSVMVAGDGSERHKLSSLARARGLPIEFIGPLPQPHVQALCRACDAGFLGWLDRPLYRFGIAPQKRGLMLGEGLPLIHAVPHGLIDEAKLGTGWSVPASDHEAIARAIESMLVAPSDMLNAMRIKCIAHAREHLDWDRIALLPWSALSRLASRSQSDVGRFPSRAAGCR